MKFSPSQLSTWRMCRRKWFYASVLRLPQPEQASTQLGTRVHGVLEKWLGQEEYEVPPDLANILKPVFEDPFYQSLVGKVTVEAHANSPLGAYVLNGRIDVFWQDPDDPHHWYVMDHKTSKDPSKWAKTVGEAEVDPQTVCYSYDIFEKKGAHRVTTIYAYIGTQKKGPVQYVYAQHTKESMERLLREMEYDLDCMARVRADPNEDSVPRTTSACWSFGGCPFKERCFSSTSPNEGSTVDAPELTQGNGNETMNIHDLLNRNNKKPVETPAPAPAPTPVAAMLDLPQVKQPSAPTPAPTVTVAAAVVETPPVVTSAPETTTPAPETTTPAPEKKKRGRPKKNAQPAETSTEDSSSDDTSIVLVGCLPMGEHCPSIEQWLVEDTDLVSRYEAATREGYLEDQYGKGVRLISAELIASLKAGGVSLPRFVFLAKDSPFAKYLIGGLKGLPGVSLVVGV